MPSTQTISVGVTGGIGSGKSYVCHILREMGHPVFNTDEEARRLMTTDAALIGNLSDLVGNPVLDGVGNLRKSLLSEYIRSSKANAQRINALVHPEVRRSMHEWVKIQSVPVAFIECALLFETNFDKDVDYVMLVSAPMPLRIERVMKRDGKSYEEVCQWISMQMDETEKEKRAHFVIVNGIGNDLIGQLHKVIRAIHDESF